MQELAIVTAVQKKSATVKIEKNDECSKCGMCLFPKGASFIEFVADNPINAKVGDNVIIERKQDGKFLGAVLVFFIPLLLIIISAILGFYVIKWDLFVLIASIPLIILWYIILSFIDKKIRKLSDFRAIIVEIKGEQ